tara:strand:- start:21939 stop:23666 length:1728 start_codon:yes stop_codon:yes gene_type:complete
MKSKKPTTSQNSGRSNATRATAHPATPAASIESIDHLPLPPLDPAQPGTLEALPLDEIVGDLGDDLGFGMNVDNLFDTGMGDVLGTDHMAEYSGGAFGENGANSADGDKHETSDDAEESDEKKRARLVRNRESAMLSRQRKKQYVDDLERKLRIATAQNTELQGLLGRLFAETEGLRHHLSLATGKPPVTRGVILEHPPPPGVALQAPKMAIPRVLATAGVGGEKGPVPTPTGATANATPAPSSAAGSAPGSPERVTDTKKRRRTAPGGALAAAATGTLAVLSVVCVAFERNKGGANSSSALANWKGGGAVLSTHEHMPASTSRRLLALEGEVLHPMSSANPMSSAKQLGVTLPGSSISDELYHFDGYDAYDSYETQSENNPGASFSKPYAGTDDPWFAAFHAAGLRRQEEFRRVVCVEMFRFQPTGEVSGGGEGDEDSAVVSSEAFVQRLQSEVELEEEDQEYITDAPRPSSRPELLPKAIPMSAAETKTTSSSMMSSPSGLPVSSSSLPPRPPRVTMGSIVHDDSSLVSVLLPPTKKTAGKTSAFETLSKLFVVTFSKQREDYVTYSCRLPTM